jgi:multidrug transporter EmrE-like cation transporter
VKTPLSSILLVLFSSFVGSFGAVFLKSGSSRLKRDWKSLFLNPRLAAGVCLFLLSSYFFVRGIREGELTILYPMLSFGYIWTLLWSRLFFGEPFTPNKFYGLALIAVGITCLQLGNH